MACQKSGVLHSLYTAVINPKNERVFGGRLESMTNTFSRVRARFRTYVPNTTPVSIPRKRFPRATLFLPQPPLVGGAGRMRRHASVPLFRWPRSLRGLSLQLYKTHAHEAKRHLAERRRIRRQRALTMPIPERKKHADAGTALPLCACIVKSAADFWLSPGARRTR